MPTPDQFLEAFGLVPGLRLNGYTLVSAKGQEIIYQRYKDYRFNFTLRFQSTSQNVPQSQTQSLLYSVWNMTQNKSLEVMAIKNYYTCSFYPYTISDVYMTDDYSVVEFRIRGIGVR